jgi:glycine hydroxymethyltransferase
MDKQLWRIIEREIRRQEQTIELIPSENFVDLETLFLVGSPLMNKYAEGYIGKRYYPGNEYIDQLEGLAKARALQAFGLNPKNWSVNVQPYSGSPANLAAYLGLVEPKATIMGLNLFSGGHLTHGHRVSYTSKLFNSIQYSVDAQTERIDYNQLEKLARKHKPKIIISGTTAYPRKIDFRKIGEIAKSIGAYHIADIAHIAGLVIAKLHPSPFPFADVVTLTTHKTLRGPRAGVIFMRKALETQINRSVFPGLQGGPHMHTISAIAFAFGQARKNKFINYQKQIVKNCKTLEVELQRRGFNLYAGGTDNHLLMIDLRPLGLTGNEAEKIIKTAGIVANRNSLPSDTSPFNPSGLRLGTPAVTARGMRQKEMQKIALWLERLLIKRESPKKIGREVRAILKNFPLPYSQWLKIATQELSRIDNR